MWYDKKGKLLVTAELGTPEWKKQQQAVEKLLTDPTYKIVKQEYTPNKKYLVSTVWLGLDHGWAEGETPVIFETMVFDAERNDLVQERYCTEEDALVGHKKMFTKFKRMDK